MLLPDEDLNDECFDLELLFDVAEEKSNLFGLVRTTGVEACSGVGVSV